MGGKYDYCKLDSIYYSVNRWLKLGFDGHLPFQPCHFSLHGKYAFFKNNIYFSANFGNLAYHFCINIWRNFACASTICGLKIQTLKMKKEYIELISIYSFLINQAVCLCFSLCFSINFLMPKQVKYTI